MNGARRDRGRAAGDDTEAGFTLVEVVIAVTLLALIMGALTAAFITSIKLASDTTQHTKESNDAQLIAAFFVRDAQAAGATNAITGSPDGNYGVTLNDATGCTIPSGDSAVVRFEWLDRQSAAPGQSYDDIAVYYYVPPAAGKSGQLVRQTCGGPPNFPSNLALAKNIPTPPSATCDPSDCAGSPTSVSLSVSEVQTTTPYIITASTRPEGQPAAPANATGAPAPLVLLGDGTCSGTAPLAGSGNVPLKVFGNAFIEGGASGCDAYAVDNYTVTGHTEAIAPAKCPNPTGCTDIAGISARDPYAAAIAASTLKPPSPGAAGSPCSGPADDQHAQPGHFTSFSVTAGDICNLASGVYYVDGGFTVPDTAAVNTDGNDVLIYLASGQFSIDGKLSASAGTDYDGFVLWQAASDTQQLKAGPASNVHLNGVVYAPGADFNASRRVAMKSFVGKSLNFDPAPPNDPSYDVSQIGLITPSETSMTTGSPSTLPPILDQAASDETIRINGSNFVAGATVAFSGDGIMVNSATVVDSTRIDVHVSISDSADPTERDVIITNPDTGVDIEDSAFTVEPRPTITSVTLANGVGTPGVIDAGDTIAVQFSKEMRESSICSLWTGGDDANPTINADSDVTVVATNGAPSDTITITSKDDCNGAGTNASLGTIDLGGTGYVTGAPETFAGAVATLTSPSMIHWDATTRTLTITLGTETPAPLPLPAPQPVPVPASSPTYTVPDRFTDTRGAKGGMVTPPTFTIAPPAVQF
jgi:type II secretory pathway pseudopilin PulG